MTRFLLLRILLLLGYTSYISARWTTTTSFCQGTDSNDPNKILKTITDVETCKAAASALSISYDSGFHMLSVNRRPGGCVTDRMLEYNYFALSMNFYDHLDKPCNYVSDENFCLCESLPTCNMAFDEGLPNNDSCFCEDESCTPDTGLYCSEMHGCYGGDSCLQRYGATENSHDCMCGTTPSNSQRGRFCYWAASMVSSDPINICANTDGSEINNGCLCGTDTCGENKYCTEQFSLCTAIAVPSFCQMDGAIAANVSTCALQVNQLQGEKSALQADKSALQDSNTALQGEKSALQNNNTALQGEKSALQADKLALQGEKSALQADKLALQAICVDRNKPDDLREAYKALQLC